MLLQLQTWVEVEAYLRSSRSIVLPIGSPEQHGPIGLIGTDAICAEVIARGVGDAAGALVAPDDRGRDGPASPRLRRFGDAEADDADRRAARHCRIVGSTRLRALLFHQRAWRKYCYRD